MTIAKLYPLTAASSTPCVYIPAKEICSVGIEEVAAYGNLYSLKHIEKLQRNTHSPKCRVLTDKFIKEFPTPAAARVFISKVEIAVRWWYMEQQDRKGAAPKSVAQNVQHFLKLRHFFLMPSKKLTLYRGTRLEKTRTDIKVRDEIRVKPKWKGESLQSWTFHKAVAFNFAFDPKNAMFSPTYILKASVDPAYVVSTLGMAYGLMVLQYELRQRWMTDSYNKDLDVFLVTLEAIVRHIRRYTGEDEAVVAAGAFPDGIRCTVVDMM